MKISKQKRMALLVLLVALIVIMISVILFAGKTVSQKEKIGFVMTGSVNEEGWNGMHYKGVCQRPVKPLMWNFW